MNQMPLSHVVHLGIDKINRSGSVFKPNISRLVTDLSMSNGVSGVIALPPENPHRNYQGYDLVKLSTPAVSLPEITVDDLWTCAKKHYGLTAAIVIAGIGGGFPIRKVRLGYKVTPGSSKYTNLVSHYGHKFFLMARLPHGFAAARVAKSAFGTIRVFGIIGRALPFVAFGLAVYDAISIGVCAYEERSRK